MNILITGASGWLGKEIISFYYGLYGESIKECLFPISHTKAEIDFHFGKVKCYKYDEIKNLENVILYHVAFITNDKAKEMNEKKYEEKNLELRQVVVNLIKNNSIKSMFYASSGAVYTRNTREIVQFLKEDPYGYCKAQDEMFFQNLCEKLKAKLIISRIFSLFGRHINKSESYAISNMINQARNNKTIQIKSTALTYRNYIYTQDLIAIIHNWLLDTGNEKFYLFDSFGQTLEMQELASMIVDKYCISKENIIRNLNKNLPSDNYFGHDKEQNILTERYKLNKISVFSFLESLPL